MDDEQLNFEIQSITKKNYRRNEPSITLNGKIKT